MSIRVDLASCHYFSISSTCLMIEVWKKIFVVYHVLELIEVK